MLRKKNSLLALSAVAPPSTLVRVIVSIAEDDVTLDVKSLVVVGKFKTHKHELCFAVCLGQQICVLVYFTSE